MGRVQAPREISDKDLVRALRALADPSRFRMVQEIAAAGELSCGQIAEKFDVSQPTISHHLKILADAGVTNNVEWTSTSKPAEAYRSAHVFCLPSISEAMPFSVIEAMLCGCPVVATDVGNVQEMLQETGIAVTPNDPEALAGALVALLGEDGEFLREALAAAALERALGIYTIESSTGRYRRLYHAALREPSRVVEREPACSST